MDVDIEHRDLRERWMRKKDKQNCESARRNHAAIIVGFRNRDVGFSAWSVTISQRGRRRAASTVDEPL
jgi:hypothetical protein